MGEAITLTQLKTTLERLQDTAVFSHTGQSLTKAEQAQARANIGITGTGADGYTPVKGTDYWTDADKEEIVEEITSDETLIDTIAEIVKTEVPYVTTAEQPTFVSSVDEMTDTSKVYVMSDGYLYAYMETEAGNYNLFKLSEVTYSSRLQDDVEGIVSSTATNAVTGWIPVEYGKFYSISALYNGVRSTEYASYVRANLQLSDGTIVVYNSNCVPQTGTFSHRILNIEYEDAVAIQLHFRVVTSLNGSAVDISTAALLGAYEPMLVAGDTADEAYENAMNLTYIDGDEEIESVTEWYNTGLAYNQPVDYEDRIIELESDVADLQSELEELGASVENPASASPFYRTADFGVLPCSYYQGVGSAYDTTGFVQGTTYATFIELWKSLVADHSSYVTETELGAASDGQMVYLYDFKPARISNQDKPVPKIIIVAGQHGFEKSNIYGLYYFVDNLLNRWTQHPVLEYLRNHVRLMIVPVLNTYGFDTLSYTNGNGVNLNRNYDSNWVLVEDTTSVQYGGAEPFDQSETQYIRDLLDANDDASLVVDFHTNGMSSVTEYANINWCGLCASDDSFYNRMLSAASHHLSALSAHFNLDYSLGQPDTMMGHMTNYNGNGLLRGWATDNNIVGVLVEGFNGFVGGTAFTADVYKANEEIIVNYIINAMNYLGK